MVPSEAGQGGAAVLLSGGLDSAVLLADVARRDGPARVQPVYVSAGLAWEAEERAMIERLLAAPAVPRRSSPLVASASTCATCIPPTHWAIRGEPPGFDTPDEDVYLEGRNVVLLTKAAIFCRARQVDAGRHRPARRQPVPGRNAGILRRDGTRAVTRPGHDDRHRRTVCRSAQG